MVGAIGAPSGAIGGPSGAIGAVGTGGAVGTEEPSGISTDEPQSGNCPIVLSSVLRSLM
jgi:hypothetical protein